MPYDQFKDALDNGNALNIADLNECGIGTTNYVTHAGYMIDLVASFTATNASSGMSLASFKSLLDGKASTDAAVPQTSTGVTPKYVYIKLTTRTRLNKLLFRASSPFSTWTTLSAAFTAATGTTPPSTGWTALTVSSTWNSTEGYAITPPGAATYFDALWLRFSLVYSGAYNTGEPR